MVAVPAQLSGAAVVAIALLFVSAAPRPTAGVCLGQFIQCNDTAPGVAGACAIFAEDCELCMEGEYVCPDRATCAPTAEAYADCPGITGTHLDPTLSIAERIAYMVNHTSLSDRVSQLWNWAPALEDLYLPAYGWLDDDEHGLRGTHSVSYASGCGLGASFDKELFKSVGEAIGTAARSTYAQHVRQNLHGLGTNGNTITPYAPFVNPVRDVRWGRAQESFGEDPNLVASLAVEMIAGMQGDDDTYLQLAACAKHYAAYDLENIPVWRKQFDANVTARNMGETYLYPFQRVTTQADVALIMVSYNAINGVPTAANEPLLQHARDTWGWEGVFVGDYDCLADIYSTFGYCPSYECAAAKGFGAGMNQEGGGTSVIDEIPAAVSSGALNASLVDDSFARLMEVRIRLGMLDPPTMVPYNYIGVNASEADTAAHIALSRLTAQEAAGLYVNNDAVLPLDAAKTFNIALIGPQVVATTLLQGNYADPPDTGIVNILQGVTAAYQGTSETVVCSDIEENVDYYQPGDAGIPARDVGVCCNYCSWDPSCNFWTYWEGNCYLKATDAGKTTSSGRVSGAAVNVTNPDITWAPGCADVACGNTTLFSDAVYAAKNADIIIATFGLDQTFESEGKDRTTIALPGNQQALLNALAEVAAAQGTPLVGVMIHGGTLELNISNFDALIDMWYPSQQGGGALADVLFGKYSPAGRAAVSYYSSDAQLPTPGEMDWYAGLGIGYRYYTGTPVVPFGHGLSYTSFGYSSLTTNVTGAVGPCDFVGVSVKVTNTGGSVTSDEVVQLYLVQNNASVPVPNVRLADFERVRGLAPGASATVNLVVSPYLRAIVSNTTDVYNPVYSSEAGSVTIYVGGGQPAYAKTVSTTLDVAGPTTKLSTCTY